MCSSNKAAQKVLIMNYEQLLSSVFSCFHRQKFKIFKKILHCSVRTKKLLNNNKKNIIFFLIIFFCIFYRLPADLNPTGKSNKTLWRHLFFLICDYFDVKIRQHALFHFFSFLVLQSFCFNFNFLKWTVFFSSGLLYFSS